MLGSNLGGRLTRAEKFLARRSEGQAATASDDLAAFLRGLSDEDFTRVRTSPPPDDRARALHDRLRALWRSMGKDPGERRRRLDTRARLLPILELLTPEQWERVEREPAHLAQLVR